MFEGVFFLDVLLEDIPFSHTEPFYLGQEPTEQEHKAKNKERFDKLFAIKPCSFLRRWGG